MARRFAAEKITDNKLEVRDRLYDDVQQVFPKAKRFGMLAGGRPRDEVECVLSRFYRAEVVAFDRHEPFVAAARVCGAEGVLGNLVKTVAAREFDFFDLDLCKSLSTTKREIQGVAASCRLGMSVFVSYGQGSAASGEDVRAQERANQAEKIIDGERAVTNEKPSYAERVEEGEKPAISKRTEKYEKPVLAERVNDDEKSVAAERVINHEQTTTRERVKAEEETKFAERLTVAQKGRALLLWDLVREVRPEATIARVYVYRGNATMMLGVLFSFSKAVELPPFCPASEERTIEREVRLRRVGVRGRRLAKKLKNGEQAAKKFLVSQAENPKRDERVGARKETNQPERAVTFEKTIRGERK